MSGTLRDTLAGHLAAQPDRTLLIAPETGRRLSYRDLDWQARMLARWLRAAGLKPGDKVGIYLHNSYQTAALFLGAMLGGYVVAPLNLLSQRSQLAYVIGHCDCKILFTAREYEEPLAAALAELQRKVEVVVIDPDASSCFWRTGCPPRTPVRIRPAIPRC
jgi:acyl-CoA synthetase (AMP-forming)/AMP-acid ligase II